MAPSGLHTAPTLRVGKRPLKRLKSLQRITAGLVWGFGMIERGERNPALLNLIRLASALDISLPELLRTMLMTETVIMNLTDSYGFLEKTSEGR